MNAITLPKTAILELTYECNHQCKFCSCPWENTANPHLFFEKKEELSIDEWKKVLSILERQDIETVGISGGEALLKEGLSDLLWHIRENAILNKDKKITLVSNGAAMDEAFLSLFADTGVHLSLSLPGLDTFQYHTGTTANSAGNVLHWIKRASEEGITTTVNVTATKQNIHELYEIIANALLAGADTLLLNRFLIGGRGVSYKDELSLSQKELQEVFDTADAILETSGRVGSLGTETPFCALGGREYKHLATGSMCAAAKRNGFFVIDPSGYVRACNHSPKRLGYIFDKEIIRDINYWKLFADRAIKLPEMCVGCEFVNRCDAGCREAAYICYGSLSAPDPCMITE